MVGRRTSRAGGHTRPLDAHPAYRGPHAGGAQPRGSTTSGSHPTTPIVYCPVHLALRAPNDLESNCARGAGQGIRNRRLRMRGGRLVSGHEQSFRNEMPHRRNPHGPQRLNVAGNEVPAVPPGFIGYWRRAASDVDPQGADMMRIHPRPLADSVRRTCMPRRTAGSGHSDRRCQPRMAPARRNRPATDSYPLAARRGAC